jgi:tRNA dimethylallyltransferase
MKKVVIVIGPTASGKTDYTLKNFSDDRYAAINVDSMQVYEELSIGNNKGKLVKQDREVELSRQKVISLAKSYCYPGSNLIFWGFNLCKPCRCLNVADFQQIAREIVEEIIKEGKTPVLVGGSGLYLASVVYDYHFNSYGSHAVKEKIITAYGDNVSKLEDELKRVGFNLNNLNHSDRNNPRRLQNVLAKEVGSSSLQTRTNSSRTKFYQFEVRSMPIDLDSYKQILRDRVLQMMDSGLIAEVERLIAKYGFENICPQIKSASGYKQVFSWLETRGSTTKVENNSELVEEIVNSHYRLAKKQLTWNRKYFPN